MVARSHNSAQRRPGVNVVGLASSVFVVSVAILWLFAQSSWDSAGDYIDTPTITSGLPSNAAHNNVDQSSDYPLDIFPREMEPTEHEKEADARNMTFEQEKEAMRVEQEAKLTEKDARIKVLEQEREDAGAEKEAQLKEKDDRIRLLEQEKADAVADKEALLSETKPTSLANNTGSLNIVSIRSVTTPTNTVPSTPSGPIIADNSPDATHDLSPSAALPSRSLVSVHILVSSVVVAIALWWFKRRRSLRPLHSKSTTADADDAPCPLPPLVNKPGLFGRFDYP